MSTASAFAPRCLVSRACLPGSAGTQLQWRAGGTQAMLLGRVRPCGPAARGVQLCRAEMSSASGGESRNGNGGAVPEAGSAPSQAAAMSRESGRNEEVMTMAWRSSSNYGGREWQRQEPQSAAVVEPELTGFEGWRVRAGKMLHFIDEVGSWSAVSSVVIFCIFALETYQLQVEASGTAMDYSFMRDVLLSRDELSQIEQGCNVMFLAEYVLRWWVNKFSLAHVFTPLALVDALSILPPLLSTLGINPQFVRFLRLFRVLRLLRLLDRSPKSVFFGIVRTDEMTVQLFGVVIEALIVFFIAAGVIFDFEVAENDLMNNMGDALYWTFCTLTGQGQPFNIVTTGGKVACVTAQAVALVVVPGQIAKLATVTGSRMMTDSINDLQETRKALAAAEERIFDLEQRLQRSGIRKEQYERIESILVANQREIEGLKDVLAAARRMPRMPWQVEIGPARPSADWAVHPPSPPTDNNAAPGRSPSPGRPAAETLPNVNDLLS